MATQITLESARVNAGYSQKEIAKLLDKSIKTISNWENGKTPISADVFFQLCKHYNIDSDNVKVPIVNNNKY